MRKKQLTQGFDHLHLFTEEGVKVYPPFKVEVDVQETAPSARVLDKEGTEVKRFTSEGTSAALDVMSEAELFVTELDERLLLTSTLVEEHEPVKKEKGGGGMTLIEVMAAALVILTLFALMLPTPHYGYERTYLSSVRNSLNNAVVAQEIYYDEHGSYAKFTEELAKSIGYENNKGVIVEVLPIEKGYEHGFQLIGMYPTEGAICRVAYGENQDGKIHCYEERKHD